MLVAGLLSFGITALLTPTANAEPTKTVFNPFTGKLDYITKIDTSTFAGVTLSSGIKINIPTGVITSTSVITSTMSVIIASCTTRGLTPNAWITLNLESASSNVGTTHFIYNVGADSCSIKIAAQPGELIESSGTARLDAQMQHASIHSLGNGMWGAGPGGIQYTPWSLFTTQDDVGTFAVATSSLVYSCPVYNPVPLAVMGFRWNRTVNAGWVSTALTDMNGKYVVGVSTQLTISGVNNYLTGGVTQLAPGWYRWEITANNTATLIAGSNSVNSSKMFCSSVGTNTFGLDLSQFTPSLPGLANSVTYPAVDLIFNGGLQGF